MKLTIHGAARTVTGSQHLLDINGSMLLLDCGMFQGRRQESFELNRRLAYSARDINAVILSHAHIDHCGNLPSLVKNGYEGPIYATPATAHLTDLLVMDAAHIQESDVMYVNKKNSERGLPLVEPLYTQEDAARVAQHLVPCGYDQPFEPVPGVAARLVDAGHILGSAAVVLEIEEKGRSKLRLWFSGDIGRRDLPLINDPVLPQNIDYLLMECTYGDKPHQAPEIAFAEMRQVVLRTVERRGKVIIPAFAVGRTQEIVYNLHKMIEAKDIPDLPVYVDSPLAVNVTDVFRQHPECFDDETLEFIRQDKHRQALGFDHLVYTRSVEESKAINNRPGPLVIISASGMAETGRILHHLKNNIGDTRNTIMIVSWQAPYTLGRRLADREPRVRIFGEEYAVRAEVATIGGLSAHAGQDFLTEYALAARSKLRQLFLVHGEPKAAQALIDKLQDARFTQITYPEAHTTIEI